MKPNFIRERNIHRKISKALIENDNDFLIKEYGSRDIAEEKLHELEHLLNYGSLSGYKDRGDLDE